MSSQAEKLARDTLRVAKLNLARAQSRHTDQKRELDRAVADLKRAEENVETAEELVRLAS